jgi:hypothetical protein
MPISESAETARLPGCRAESYSGDFDVVSPSDRPPNDAPEQCSPVRQSRPVWWYILQPVRNEANQLVGSIALPWPAGGRSALIAID